MATQALFDIGNVFLEPSSTFARLKAKTHAWLPLALTIVLSVGLMYWWISTVDFPWLVDRMASAQAKPEVQAAMRQMTQKSMMVTTVIGAVIGSLFVYALSAVYYLIAGKVLGSDIGYGKWFGFTVWTSVPRLLAIPLSAFQIMSSGGRVAAEDLNMVSLNYLVLHLPASHPWAGFANGIDLTSLWCIFLAVIGLRAWTGRSTGTCVTVALLPYVIIYGLWAAKIAFLG